MSAMAKADLDDRIDQLYQLPLDEFTAARNALAKDAGDRAGEVKKLEKPNLAAWAVNQLYWKERDAYEAVIKAAEKMRAAYKQMLAGKSADVRAAEDVHQDALKAAKQAARRILDEGGHPNPDAVMMPVAETLDALPGEEQPGRLTKPLRRMGFNVLEGLPISAKAGPAKPAAKPKEPAKEISARERRTNEAEERELAMARERLRFAEAAEREAESSVERAGRALERLQRIRERAEKEFEDAVRAEKAAEKEISTAEKSLERASAERERLASVVLPRLRRGG